jgi:hypothetical protein
MTRLLGTLVFLAFSAPLAAQWLSLATPGVPRTADGKPSLTASVPRDAQGRPDLTGLWARRSVSGDLLDFSKVQEWARATREQHALAFFDTEPSRQCLPRGPDFVGTAMRRIVQSPSFTAVLNDDLTYRQIFTDGRALEPNPNPIWMGYSVGRWDGDTLIVESNGFNDRTWLNPRGLVHTERLRVTERYRRLDFGHMALDVTYEDPGTFDAPLTANIALELVVDNEMLETVCNESSEGRKHWVGEVAHAEATAVVVAPAILARYVGTYRGLWVTNLTTVRVTLENDGLVLQRNGETFRLLPQSDNTFACTCGLGYVFPAKGDEMATEVDEVHVSGAWTFARVTE